MAISHIICSSSNSKIWHGYICCNGSRHPWSKLWWPKDSHWNSVNRSGGFCCCPYWMLAFSFSASQLPKCQPIMPNEQIHCESNKYKTTWNILAMIWCTLYATTLLWNLPTGSLIYIADTHNKTLSQALNI